mgnify:CR=1 FL=1
MRDAGAAFALRPDQHLAEHLTVEARLILQRPAEPAGVFGVWVFGEVGLGQRCNRPSIQAFGKLNPYSG